jgi:hypothetical protein
MSPVGFEPAIPASAGPQTYALDRAATGIGTCYCSEQNIFTRPDNCAALLKFFYNMHNKNIYNEN